MHFHILTLFPEALESYLKSSILGKNIEEKKLEVSLVNFREFSKDKHKKVDDLIYGGSTGMLLQCDPIIRAIESIYQAHSKLIFLTPIGETLTQNKVAELSTEEEMILVCGFYEGFDARIYHFFDHEKISIGDYILTNGALASLVLVDAVSRAVTLKGSGALEEESFQMGLRKKDNKEKKEKNCFLEYHQYTRPREYRGEKVPEVLLSGDHKKIRDFQKKSSYLNTLQYRPELLARESIDSSDLEWILSWIDQNNIENT